MGRKSLSKEELNKTLDAYIAHSGDIDKTANYLGIGSEALSSRLRKPELKEFLTQFSSKTPKITVKDLPAADLATDQIIKIMCDRFSKRKNNSDAAKWRPFHVHTDLPIGINWFGDPHLDDNGCNWPLLTKHCEIISKTPGMFGANIGDTTNNWVGRLMREYANQETSVDTSYKLIEWFFEHSGVDWLIMLTGNHDTWNDGARLLKKMCENVCPMVDWRAQFKLVFSNNRECLIDAAHNHKGHSQWNALHGQQKASSMGGLANLYIAGHLHNWALAQNECSETGRVYHLARVRGYKYIDEYATVNGFGSQEHGASVVSVIDPRASDLNLVRCFADVQEGADYLTWLRKKYE